MLQLYDTKCIKCKFLQEIMRNIYNIVIKRALFVSLLNSLYI
ncbi:hypothetical protein Runsl_4985 [Runella slithyformis DSM 19594]|uniref:Uncharacterized protein n=1 Tax=Runella slithyformis (strain ATCC 29530 / DSM 19594 / LMG 11500 / NCIMB 11436 / LSU 4) TaxID=761193 RepID=A0A7U4E8C4_RUNSL|nr:hypothetical protein Runsl_4985 [Runella slithyformis DSM 19594]